MNSRLISFAGGSSGEWAVTGMTTIVGDSLPGVSRLAIVGGAVDVASAGSVWCLRSITSNERYVTAQEKAQLIAKQERLGRPSATHAALIPIRKTTEW